MKDFTPSEHQQEDVKLVFTSHVPMNVDGDPRTFIDPNESTGPVCISNELGAIIDTSRSDNGLYKHAIVIKKRGRRIKSVDSQHRMKEPLMYPLLFLLFRDWKEGRCYSGNFCRYRHYYLDRQGWLVLPKLKVNLSEIIR